MNAASKSGVTVSFTDVEFTDAEKQIYYISTAGDNTADMDASLAASFLTSTVTPKKFTLYMYSRSLTRNIR